jgi:hypothetical protein
LSEFERRTSISVPAGTSTAFVPAVVVEVLRVEVVPDVAGVLPVGPAGAGWRVAPLVVGVE